MFQLSALPKTPTILSMFMPCWNINQKSLERYHTFCKELVMTSRHSPRLNCVIPNRTCLLIDLDFIKRNLQFKKKKTFMSISSCLPLFLHKTLGKKTFAISATHGWKQFNFKSSFFPFGFTFFELFMLLVKEKVELCWISYLILLFSHTVKTIRSLNSSSSVKNVLTGFRKNKQMKNNREDREGRMQIPDDTHQKCVSYTFEVSWHLEKKGRGYLEYYSFF